MSLTLRCAVTGDLLLLSTTAEQLLGLLGKQASEPGILQPADMPAALQTLRNLPSPAEEAAAKAQSSDEAEESHDGKDGHTPSFQDERVSLRQRAWPLIQMIERAQAADKPIVWGV
jgi:hypothetical protein